MTTMHRRKCAALMRDEAPLWALAVAGCTAGLIGFSFVYLLVEIATCL